MAISFFELFSWDMQQQTLLSFRTGKLRFRPLLVFVPGERMKKGQKRKRALLFQKTKEYSGGNDCFQAKVLAMECLFLYLVLYRVIGIGTSFRNSLSLSRPQPKTMLERGFRVWRESVGGKSKELPRFCTLVTPKLLPNVFSSVANDTPNKKTQ